MTHVRVTSTEQVVKTILTGIQKGTFVTGQRLPSQRELSDMFGVSRMVIREAIKILEGRGVLFSKRGSGTFVMQTIDNVDTTYFNSVLDLKTEDVYVLSSLILKSCTNLVVDNASDDELLDLYTRVKEMHDNYNASTTLQAKYIYETSFGLRISKLTHNQLIYKLMVEMFSLTSNIDYQVIKNNKNYMRMIEIDLMLLEALRARDTYRAKFWSDEREIEIHKALKQGNNSN